jgi:hypothetical protein
VTAGPNDLVGRLHRRLLEEVSRRGTGHSFTIAELYQQLIPYRGVRGDLGVLELAEYEHALLRLLSGERELLRVTDERVRSELAAELDSPNPILGIYRDYSAATLEVVNAPLEGGSLEEGGDEAGEFDPSRGHAAPRQVMEMAELADEEGEETEEWPADPPPLPEITAPGPRPFPADATRVANRPVPPEPPRPVTSAGPRRSGCVSCAGELPDVDGLRFCPHCGADQTEHPSAQCASPIRAEWNFCIRCGARRPAAPGLD